MENIEKIARKEHKLIHDVNSLKNNEHGEVFYNPQGFKFIRVQITERIVVYRKPNNIAYRRKLVGLMGKYDFEELRSLAKVIKLGYSINKAWSWNEKDEKKLEKAREQLEKIIKSL